MTTAGLALLGMVSAANAALRAGEAAPPFRIEAARGGKTFSFDLAAALAKGPVVVYFYPKSFTSTCTIEAHAFAEAIPAFEAEGASVIGLSGDGIDTQKEFSSKECRDTFPVGADLGLAVAKRYDVALTIPGTDIGYARRTSFVIAPDGQILSTVSDSDAQPHIENALATVKAWRADHPKAKASRPTGH